MKEMSKQEALALVRMWQRNIDEIHKDMYVGGMPGRPLFASYTKQEKIDYCKSMIDKIKLENF